MKLGAIVAQAADDGDGILAVGASGPKFIVEESVTHRAVPPVAVDASLAVGVQVGVDRDDHVAGFLDGCLRVGEVFAKYNQTIQGLGLPLRILRLRRWRRDERRDALERFPALGGPSDESAFDGEDAIFKAVDVDLCLGLCVALAFAVAAEVDGPILIGE